MHNDELDRLLSGSHNDEILPSSGFTASVMETVRHEAAMPPPIPFPWRHALPGALAALLTLGLVLYGVVTQASRVAASTPSFSLPASLASANVPGLGTALLWTTAALLFSFVVAKLSMRLARSRV